MNIIASNIMYFAICFFFFVLSTSKTDFSYVCSYLIRSKDRVPLLNLYRLLSSSTLNLSLCCLVAYVLAFLFFTSRAGPWKRSEPPASGPSSVTTKRRRKSSPGPVIVIKDEPEDDDEVRFVSISVVSGFSYAKHSWV